MRHHDIGTCSLSNHVSTLSTFELTTSESQPASFAADALDYDKVCDASLPLEDILSPSPSLRALLQSIDPSKARIFGLTNAYQTHARRVLSIIGVDDLLEGLVFCDYAQKDGNFSCKPELSFYNEVRLLPLLYLFFLDVYPGVEIDPQRCAHSFSRSQAIHHAAGSPSAQYFIDDSLLNIRASLQLTPPWRAVHYKEVAAWDADDGRVDVVKRVETDAWETVKNLEELREVWKEIFKSDR